MSSQYKWPRDNLDEYKFDVGCPNDVNPSEIVVPFTSWIQENEYRIAHRNRFVAIAYTEKRDWKQAFDWKFS